MILIKTTKKIQSVKKMKCQVIYSELNVWLSSELIHSNTASVHFIEYNNQIDSLWTASDDNE